MLDKNSKAGKKGLTRRRVVSIMALAGVVPASFLASKAKQREEPHFKWQGALMGARAGLDFYGADQATARNAMVQCLAEVERLEKIFSLYRDDSQISILNSTGRLAGASLDMRQLLATSQRIARATNGAFDPTVQSLWRVNADWFAQKPAIKGPPSRQIATAQRLVDYRKITLQDGEVKLGEGQAITLNGIAQGYITDRIVALLGANGWQHVLVGMGEYYGMVNAPENKPFRLALEGAGQEVELCEEALASSRADGFVFPLSKGKGPSHLFDPKSGKSARLWQSVHVKSHCATIADGLSTACASMDARQIRKALAFFPGTTVWTVSTAGALHRFKA